MKLTDPHFGKVLQFAWRDFCSSLSKSESRKRWIMWCMCFYVLTIPLYFLFPDQEFSFLPILMPPALLFFLLFGGAWYKARSMFLSELARVNGWEYKETFTLPSIRSRMINYDTMDNYITGVQNGREFSFFDFDLAVGSGRRRKIISYVVFTFTFKGTFPDLYLNYKDNEHSLKDSGVRLPLPEAFDKKFIASAPFQYEIEGLQIFTPDVMSHLLDTDFSWDIEFTNQQMLIFVDGHINSFEDFEKKFTKICGLVDMLSHTLDIITFEKIGNKKYTL